MSKKCRICGAPISAGEVCANCLPNSNPKIPREEKSKKGSKKKLNDLDKYLIGTFITLILYTIVETITFIITGTEQAVLTGCFFTAFAGEVFLCARIKKHKLNKEIELIHKDETNTDTFV